VDDEKAPDQFAYGADDVLRLLDQLLTGRAERWWSDFFADRERPCPFLVAWPDENLAEWLDTGLVTPSRVLELGCGQGRNAIYLASRGCAVDAIDFSAEAIAWARERAEASRAPVNFQHASVFAADIPAESYDLVYDSGCFHHLAPHRRKTYVDLVTAALKPGGSYGLVCFRPEGGSGYTDLEVYQKASLGGGLGYSAERLLTLWDTGAFSVRLLRQMRNTEGEEEVFGEDFLWAMLAGKDARGIAGLDARRLG